MADKEKKPIQHIAFIMDGNGRWAKKRHLPRSAGHKAGVDRIKEVVMSCYDDFGIKEASLYCFTTENWNHPAMEIKTLFSLLKTFFLKEIDFFISRGVKVRVIGNLADERIPADVREVIEEAMRRTSTCEKSTFNVLFNYGGRFDLLQSFKQLEKKIASGEKKLESLTEKDIGENLLVPDDVDLLVRTSGEMRISNCYLYQLAYAEFVFTETYWPDFDKNELAKCIDEYYHRNRRFGAIKE